MLKKYVILALLTTLSIGSIVNATIGKLMDRTKLFDDIMGIPETLFQKQVGAISTKPDIASVNSWYDNKISELSKALTPFSQGKLEKIRSVKIGTWTQPSLNELRQRVSKKLSSQRMLTGNLRLIIHDPKNPCESDIRYLHTRYPDAFFMLASNFNALEGGMGDYRVGHDHMNTGPVQGEEAVMATMGAGIFRRYFLPRINLLQNMNHLFNIDTTYGTPIIIGLKNSTLKLTPQDMASLSIGIHSDIAVTSEYNPDNKMIHRSGQYHIPAYNLETPIIGPGSVRVSHIITSGHDLRNVDPQSEEQQDIARAIIVASYEATLLAAIDGDAKKLVLTMLGAGAFNNNPMWIVEALNRLIPVIVLSDMDIYIVVRHSNAKVQQDVQQELEKLQAKIFKQREQYKYNDIILAKDMQHFFDYNVIVA